MLTKINYKKAFTKCESLNDLKAKYVEIAMNESVRSEDYNYLITHIREFNKEFLHIAKSAFDETYNEKILKGQLELITKLIEGNENYAELGDFQGLFKNTRSWINFSFAEQVEWVGDIISVKFNEELLRIPLNEKLREDLLRINFHATSWLAFAKYPSADINPEDLDTHF